MKTSSDKEGEIKIFSDNKIASSRRSLRNPQVGQWSRMQERMRAERLVGLVGMVVVTRQQWDQRTYVESPALPLPKG